MPVFTVRRYQETLFASADFDQAVTWAQATADRLKAEQPNQATPHLLVDVWVGDLITDTVHVYAK